MDNASRKWIVKLGVAFALITQSAFANPVAVLQSTELAQAVELLTGPAGQVEAAFGRTAWGAGDGFVLAFDRGPAVLEEVEAKDRPTAMGLDPVGVPWLVTLSAVMRRSTQGSSPVWRVHYRKEASAPPLVGIGFTPDGVRIIDAAGGGALARPADLPSWQSTSVLLSGGSGRHAV